MNTFVELLARQLRSTPGQAWTLLLGGILATATLLLGLPPVIGQADGDPALSPAPFAPVSAEERTVPATPGPPPRTEIPAPGAGVAAVPAITPHAAAPGRSTAPLDGPLVGVRVVVGAPEPLRVVEAAWASVTGGTPVAPAGVPEDGLPVGSAAGADQYRSFVRLEGDADVLVLRVHSDVGASIAAASAAVQACPISEGGWRPERGTSFGAAPAFDCSAGVEGEPDDGHWRFDLSALEPGRRQGYALVPSDGSPARSFRLTFSVEPAA